MAAFIIFEKYSRHNTNKKEIKYPYRMPFSVTYRLPFNDMEYEGIVVHSITQSMNLVGNPSLSSMPLRKSQLTKSYALNQF